MQKGGFKSLFWHVLLPYRLIFYPTGLSVICKNEYSFPAGRCVESNTNLKTGMPLFIFHLQNLKYLDHSEPIWYFGSDVRQLKVREAKVFIYIYMK